METQPPEEPRPSADPDTGAGLAWELPPEPVIGPGATRRRVRAAITLVLIAAFVVVAGLGGSGFFIPSTPEVPVASLEPLSSQVPGTPGPSTAAGLAMVDGDGALSSMAADGASVITYSASDATFGFPTWSPDGTQLAAIATSADGVGIDVFKVPAVAGSADVMTTVYQSSDEIPFYLYWSPDSSTLGFLTTQFDGLALRQVPADGSNINRVVRNGAPMYWQWIDPTRLFVHSGNAPDAFVGEVALDGADAEPTTARAGLFRAPALSRTGAYLAYASGGLGGAAAVVIESRDGTLHHEQLVFGASAFEFAPAGDTLAFIAAASAEAAGSSLPVGPLRTIDPVTGAVETLLDGPVVAFFWSPDGSTIAALRLNEPGGTPAVAGLAAAGPVAARVLVRLVFVDVVSGSVRSEQTVRLSDLFTLQILPYFDQYALSHRFWSPDSASLVLPVADDRGVPRIAIIPADGSDPRTFANGVMGSWRP